MVRRGGVLESSRPGGAGGGEAAGTSVHRLCRQHAGNQEKQRLLKSLPRMVQQLQTCCRLLTSSAESYRSFVDRQGGKCANGVDTSNLSSERLHPAADSDRCRHPQPEDGAWGLLWKNRRKNCGLRRG